MHRRWVCFARLADLARPALILGLAPHAYCHLPTLDATAQTTIDGGVRTGMMDYIDNGIWELLRLYACIELHSLT